LPIQTSTFGSLKASVICLASSGLTADEVEPPSCLTPSSAAATSSVPSMCSVSMSPTFSSPTFFESLKYFEGSDRAVLL